MTMTRCTDGKPEETMAKMLKDDLGITVSAQALRMFIRWRWGRLHPLAHAIHGTEIGSSSEPIS